MFFRRPKVKLPTFEERMESLRRQGFTIENRPDGSVKVSRNGCAALVRPWGAGAEIVHAGWLLGDDIGSLVDSGFQKFWRVNGESRAPALAAQLKALHDFEEDLREALGLVSLYNTSLGTTNDLHLYDRVEGRDRGSR